jgi:hypothetical protein
MGEKFCSSCWDYRPAAGGGHKVSKSTRTVKRWLCASCVHKKSFRKYATQGVLNVQVHQSV